MSSWDSLSCGPQELKCWEGEVLAVVFINNYVVHDYFFAVLLELGDFAVTDAEGLEGRRCFELVLNISVNPRVF